MPRDGSGDYARAVTPPNNGDVASATDFNTEMNDIATALTGSININGTKAWAANQPCGGYKLTGLAAGTSNGDSVRYEQLTGLPYQPLDATLTALAALSWSSGNALVQMTAADTVSLTLTPIVSSVTASQGAAAATASGTFVNTTDSASVRALRIEGDRATPANSDVVYASWFLSNASGTQFEYGRISTIITDATAGSEDGQLYFGVALSGVQTNRMMMASTTLSPISNDAMGLGFAGVGWSDAFFAAGAVLNFSNGGVLLTHDNTNDRLVLSAGSLKARPAISTDTGGTLTSASDNCIVDLATAPTINDGIHEAGSIIVLVNNTGSSMTITQDTGMTLRLHGTATTGNLTLAARGMATVQIDPASNAEAIVTGDVS